MQKNSMAVADTVAVLEEKIFGQRSYLHHLHMKVGTYRVVFFTGTPLKILSASR